jgi:hypothetical protein
MVSYSLQVVTKAYCKKNNMWNFFLNLVFTIFLNKIIYVAYVAS